MIASLACLAALLFGATGKIEAEALAYEGQLVDELAAVAPAAVEDARRAAEAYRAERWQEAFDLYGRVLAAAPRYSHALRRQCAARSQLGERAQAIALCTRAIALQPLPENQLALARALVRTAPPAEPSAAERQRAVSLALAAVDGKPGDATVALGACDVGMRAGDAPLLDRCSAGLAALAPDEPAVGFFHVLAALAGGRLDEARGRLEAARAAGMDPALAASLAEAIDASEPPLRRYGIPAALAAGAWAALLALLVALGVVLSRATLGAAGRMARAPQGAPAPVSGVLRRTYAAVLWASCAFYYASIPLVLLAVLAAGGGALYGFLALGHVPVKLVIILAIVVLVSVWAVLKSVWVSLFRPRGGGDPGLRLDPTAEPALAAVLAEVAKRVGTRPVDAVFLTPGTDVAVFERGGVLKQLSGRSERCLILGVGVLDGMARGELKAVLAHEYGHLVNRDTAGGGFALAVRRSVLEMARTLAEGGAATWYNPAWLFVNGFHRVFLRVSQGASRLQEILADRWAALAYGGRAFGRGLRHVVERSVRFDSHAQRTLKEVVEGTLPLANLYRYAPADGGDEHAVAAAVKEALDAEPSPYDSHPRPADRIAWVAAIAARSADPDDGRPAWELFADREEVERRMTAEVRDIVRARHGVELPAAEAPAATPAA